MKVYVVGNCQAPAIALCLSRMNPSLATESLPNSADPTQTAAPGDVIFRQHVAWDPFTVRELAPNEIMYPQIWFNAFHPDSVYIAEGGTFIDGPVGQYHSLLAFWAWQRGLTAERTVELFTGPVFEQLGYFEYEPVAARAQFVEAEGAGFPLDGLLARWRRVGCFMHTLNHPRLFVIADLARALAVRAGIEIVNERPEDYLDDPFLQSTVWPVYPEIGERLGVPGSYAFKPPGASLMIPPMGLEEFVTRSFAAYDARPGPLTCGRLEHNEGLRALGEMIDAGYRPGAAAASAAPSGAGASPYTGLPKNRFWRQAVAAVAPENVDPVGDPPFTIGKDDRVATAGSCFAQHVSRALARDGFNYYVVEAAPPGLGAERAAEANFGTFSARYGNVYTARQLLQLFDRAYGTFEPRDSVWTRPDRRFADPFRAQIEPAGFATPDDVVRAREQHLAAVRTMFETLDVFVFTLGLTEAWRSKHDGAVFPTAPGVAAGGMDADEYEFHNFTVAEVVADLDAFVRRLDGVNPRARIILTVSPVPLIATYEPRHVLTSTVYSKSVLRAAADEIERRHGHVFYFPSYEIITGAFSRGAYFGPDLRSIEQAGVDHVMRLFLAHLAPQDGAAALSADDAVLLEANRADMGVVCDEEAIVASFGAAAG